LMAGQSQNEPRGKEPPRRQGRQDGAKAAKTAPRKGVKGVSPWRVLGALAVRFL
jgi:hypothetical protein